MNEFPDVFPDELPGLPPDREIEFDIDLAQCTEPISKASYRMAQVEISNIVSWFVGKKSHKTKCIPVGHTSFVCEEEWWKNEAMYWLSRV